MMSSNNNNTNQYVRSICPDSPSLKTNDYRDRRRSMENQQHNYHHENPKRSQRDRSSPTTTSKMKARVRKQVEADKVDEKEKQYGTAANSLGPYDVICGRGSVAFNNIGNRRFRVLISMNIDRYRDTKGRHRKGLFISSLVDTFQREIGTRFFKLKEGQLIELTEREIRQKVGHALRDMLAFQESQYQQYQHPRMQLQKQKQKKLQQQTESNNTTTTLPTAKLKPWIIGPMTVMPRSHVTLSSIRSHLNEIHKESDTICLHSHALGSPLLFPSTASYKNPFHNLDRNRIQRQGIRTATTAHTSTIIIAKEFSSMPNYFPVSDNMEQQRHDSRSTAASAIPHGHDVQNETSQHHCTRYGSRNSASESCVWNNHGSGNNKTEYHRDSNNCYHNDCFDHRCGNIGDSIEDMDLTPIPIDHYQEQDD